MKISQAEYGIIIITILAFLIGAYFYPLLPAKVAAHWNAAGQVDGYMSRFWGTFLMPLVSLVMAVLFIIIPRIDPKAANIEKFRGYFDRFTIILFLFLLYIYLLTLNWQFTGGGFNMVVWLVPAFAVLFYAAGILIEHADTNWSIGIRTPWTLSNEVVWKKTHALGSKLFKVSALIGLLGLIWTNLAVYFILAPVILSAFGAAVYSYIVYRKQLKV